jgi:hypothetical protein
MAVTEAQLKRMFGGEKIETNPFAEELKFLDERTKIQTDTLPLLSIDQYEESYELFCTYGLEEEMLKRTEPHIRYLSRFEPNELLSSLFYKCFKNKKLVKRYVEEHIQFVK